MYLAFLANQNIRIQKAQYLDTFYKMLKGFSPDEVHYVLTKEYLEYYPEKWANYVCNYSDIDFSVLNMSLINIPTYYEYPIARQLELYNSQINQELLNTLLNLEFNEPLEVIITWINNATLKEYAKIKRVPIIHNELGPLRPDMWKDSVYLDFEGVNANTEFEIRLKDFKKISHKLDLLSWKELLELVALDKELVFSLYQDKTLECKCGVALQVSRDSNMILYNNGWHIKDIVNYAYNKYGQHRVLIKNHPHSLLKHVEDDCNFLEFTLSKEDLLRRSEVVLTVNSSLALEALLLNKFVQILGDSPFKCLVSLETEKLVEALNFTLISYLVPSYLLFNKEYYDFRIANKGDELLLYEKGLNNWKHSKNLTVFPSFVSGLTSLMGMIPWTELT